MGRFFKRVMQQGLGALSQIAILALFIVAFPRMADDPSGWAAEYFIALAVISPIFMLFAFELRKRTAAGEGAELTTLNSKRLLGTVLATLISIALLLVLGFSSLLGTVSVFAALIVFRAGTAINEQISANYEAQDQFARALKSNLLKALAFITIAMPIAHFWHPDIAIIAGVLGFALVWFSQDRAIIIDLFNWSKGSRTKLGQDDLASGFGAFLVALTISAPRLLAATLFGEGVLNMIGVGQSLNRIGQVMSGALTQTIIAMQKKNLDRKSKEALYTFAAQIVGFGLLVLCLPLWQQMFPYADGKNFTAILFLVLLFGLLSQVNFVLQSFRLIQLGGASYVRSPVTFLFVFGALCAVGWTADLLTIWPFLALMLVARAVQITLNLMALRRAD